jgi:hypothetical protein
MELWSHRHIHYQEHVYIITLTYLYDYHNFTATYFLKKLTAVSDKMQ